jgi:hypothetical protein
MEKIFSLFGIISTLERDVETVEMVSKPGVIAYKCKLYRNGTFVGEGRGACDVAERGRVNDAIKIAEKRARMDAFTQDLEDLGYEEAEAPTAQQQGTPHEAAQWRDGEVRNLVFAVESKEMRTAQSGTVYALLFTDHGQIRAWKNTYDRFEPGHSYQAMVEASLWNSALSLAVVRVVREVDNA